MCFYARYWNRQAGVHLYGRVDTAALPIICYKYFESTSHNAKRIESPFRGHKYVVGARYDEPQFEISANSLARMQSGEGALHYGVHSYSSLDELLIHANWEHTVYKCYLPKGARYIHNPEMKQYLSNSVIITKWMGNVGTLEKRREAA